MTGRCLALALLVFHFTETEAINNKLCSDHLLWRQLGRWRHDRVVAVAMIDGDQQLMSPNV